MPWKINRRLLPVVLVGALALLAGGIATFASVDESLGSKLSLAVGSGTASPCAWPGSWETDKGAVMFSQTASGISGRYGYDGNLTGTISGSTLSGAWTQGTAAGRFQFTMSPACYTFAGTWGYGADATAAPWTGYSVTYGPTGWARSTPTVPQARCAPGTAWTGSWTGMYTSDQGRVVLTQTGTSVAGVVGDATSALSGGSPARFTGTTSGNTLTGQWVSGRGVTIGRGLQLTLAADCNSFAGSEINNDPTAPPPPWLGTRTGCSWTGTWNTSIALNGQRGTLTLTQEGRDVTGVYRDNQVQLTFKGTAAERNLAGEWVPMLGDHLGLNAVNISPNCTSFDGTVETPGIWPLTGTLAQPAAAPTATATPRATATARPCNWTGTWDTAYGALTLTQSGSTLTGTYGANKLNATVNGSTVSGKWSTASTSGALQFTMAAGCNAFTGTWGYGTASAGAGEWNGTRVSTKQ